MTEPDRKKKFEIRRGLDRKPGTGFLFRRNKYQITSTKQPRFMGEIRIPLDQINAIIEAQGVVKIAGWPKMHGSDLFMMEIKANFWKPGDTAESSAAKGDADDIPDDFWQELTDEV